MTEKDNANIEAVKPYELRGLMADDVFPMCQIISKIGLKQFKRCLESDDVKQAISAMSSGKKSGVSLEAVGMTVAIDIADILFANLQNCKKDLYLLLSQLSGMTEKEIAALPMATFFEMVIDVVKKEEFKDFFGVAAKLLK